MNLVHIGRVHSHLITRTSAPRQAHEGAPHGSLEIRPAYIEALDGLKPGMDIWVLTWLHQAGVPAASARKFTLAYCTQDTDPTLLPGSR